MISTFNITTRGNPFCHVNVDGSSAVVRVYPGGYDGAGLVLSLAELDALIEALTAARPELAALSEPVSA